MMSPNELRLQRKNTAAFIAANSIQIQLIPRTKTNTGNGPRWVDGPPREVQTFRLIDQTRTHGVQPGTVLASDGKQRQADYQLLGEVDRTIGLYDYWVDSAGIRFEVGNLVAYNDYEVRAQVIRYGEG
jgi:hypothetical protein